MFVKSLFAFAVLAPSALAAISIATPSSDAYWVQFTENRISWSYAEGDPNPVSIVITHADSNILNGEFSIEEYVPVSQESLTVTNVTLKAAPGYVVNFVNTTDHSQVYAQSSQFEVKAPGTPPYGQTVISTVIPITTTISGSAFVTSTTFVSAVTSGASLSAGASASGTESASLSASSGASNNNNGAVAVSGSAGLWTGVVALGTALVAGFLL